MRNYTLSNLFKFPDIEYFLLLPILGLAFYIAFIPHQDYPFPLHVDEWLHIAYSKAMIQSGSATITEPFFGQSILGLSTNLEAGFHLFWAAFQQLSGISWITIYRVFPAIMFVITVLSVYIFAKREGFGLEAAFFTCLIPTTVGILGPAFLVPVTLGMLFTPLILFIAYNYKTIRSYLLIFILIGFLLSIHAPSAIFPIIILAPYILLNLRGNFKHSSGLSLALILPFLLIFPWIFDLLLPTARELFSQRPLTEYVQLPKLLRTYGVLPITFTLLGTFLLALRGQKKYYSLVLGLLALLLVMVTFYTFHHGIPIMYERGLLYMMLMLGIVAGAGLAGLKNLKIPEKVSQFIKMKPVTQYLGYFLCLVAISLTLVVSVPNRLNTPYYHMIDKVDYEAFVWIRENTSDTDKLAIVDPWKSTAFTAITGRYAYTRIHAFPTDSDNRAYDFIRNGSADTDFLRQNGISIIYTRIYDGAINANTNYPSENPDLQKLANNIYSLPAVVSSD